MVIENYLDFGIPYSDLLLNYGEHFALVLAGAGILELLKNPTNSEVHT